MVWQVQIHWLDPTAAWQKILNPKTMRKEIKIKYGLNHFTSNRFADRQKDYWKILGWTVILFFFGWFICEAFTCLVPIEIVKKFCTS